MKVRNRMIAAVIGVGLAVFVAQYIRADQPRIVRLDQGWTPAQEQAFYYTTQGTVMLPAAWLAALNDASGHPFMSPEHMSRLGFVADDHSSASNPYHWPIGFALDERRGSGGTATVGFTCAACHTANLTYRGTQMRVNGGQANINLDRFKKDLNDAILATGADRSKRDAFEARAVRLGFPSGRIATDFDARYRAVVAGTADRDRTAKTATLAGFGRNDALAVIARVLFNSSIGVPSNTNQSTAPVNFPQLWNVGNLYWVQYNASARQPMSRNIGEALGVGAITHFVDPASGRLTPLPERWRTSISIDNLYALETELTTLQPPKWPSGVMGALDQKRAARGRLLFQQNCAACHAVRELAGASNDEWSVKVLPLTVIGTDPREAENVAKTTYDGTKLGLSKTATAAQGLQLVTQAIRTQAYLDEHLPRSSWAAYDGFGRPNVLTTPCGYKARPLVGVWATAPFLHNGSVPTVFDLLSETRPARFRVGPADYDPVHLGLGVSSDTNAVTIDTTLVGNSNAGHWFTNDMHRVGRIGRHLTDPEKFAIIEYLKAASYANYPRVVVQRPDPEPCVATGSYAVLKARGKETREAN